jgi:2-polyprenyl-6-methoxyphenol hydroxylase-like FAD-dependent oxidoreductase
MTKTYDLITIGGGLAGSTLAGAMAERGFRVLVLERDTHFKDRIRGEGLLPWGVEEARKLGIYDLLRSTCGHEVNSVTASIGPLSMPPRNLRETTPQHAPLLTFSHPAMQETLLEWASGKGAEVRRGVTVTAVKGGADPTVTIVGHHGPAEQRHARLIVGADGRRSMVRHWGGFTVNHDPERNIVSGVMMENMPVPAETFYFRISPETGTAVVIFPQGDSVRAYFVYPATAPYRLQNERQIPHFVEESSVVAPPEFYRGARPIGPLASYSGADSWVDHPYRNNVVLVGDAAASSDPTHGQGLQLTLRDIRVLRDQLLATDDWDDAANTYAHEHDSYYGVTHRVDNWLTELLLTPGPQAAARRDRAFGLIAEDPTRFPDHGTSGPDLPADETVRRRFFGDL